MEKRKKQRNEGLLLDSFDVNRDGKMSLSEEILMFSVLSETSEEEIINKEDSQKNSRIINIDDMDIKGI